MLASFTLLTELCVQVHDAEFLGIFRCCFAAKAGRMYSRREIEDFSFPRAPLTAP
jgi:hypothetical protein